jgi:hypothetical protein
MNALDPRLAEKLTRICGMFGSDHDGERAAAAAKADQLIRSHGLTWGQVISVAAPSTAWLTIEEQIDFCVLNGADILGPWEWEFVTGITDWSTSLTAKQRRKLEQLVAKVKTARCAA